MKRLLLVLLVAIGCKQSAEDVPRPPIEAPIVQDTLPPPPSSSPTTEKPKPVVRKEPRERVRTPVTRTDTARTSSVTLTQEEKPIEQKEEVKEPSEEVTKAMNRTVLEESFGWRAMNAVPVPAPPKHPDSMKWEDISGGPGAYMSPPTPWWIMWLAYINMAAAVILCGYLLITNG